jgi:type IV fimbrial biogenesis protein FimT
MKRLKRERRLQKGFTLTEMIVVIAIISILLTIAVPFFAQWQRSVQFRTTAREVTSRLREAQSRTITNNLQHGVEFEAPGFRRYRMVQGNRASNSTAWNPALQRGDWTLIPTEVTLVAANLTVNSSVEFNPNGTASIPGLVTIQIQDSTTGATRFTVEVETSGRIRIR